MGTAQEAAVLSAIALLLLRVLCCARGSSWGAGVCVGVSLKLFFINNPYFFFSESNSCVVVVLLLVALALLFLLGVLFLGLFDEAQQFSLLRQNVEHLHDEGDVVMSPAHVLQLPLTSLFLFLRYPLLALLQFRFHFLQSLA